MATSTDTVKRPEYGVFGLSNEGGIELLNVNNVVSEPLKKSEGLNKYTVPGIDGRGMNGKISVADGYNLHSELAHVGEVVRVTSKDVILKSVAFPSLDHSNEKYLMIFDTRRKDAEGQILPLKIFRQELSPVYEKTKDGKYLEDKDKNYVTKKTKDGKDVMEISKTVLLSGETKVVLKAASLKKEDLLAASELAYNLVVNKAELFPGFAEKLNEIKPDLNTLGGKAQLLEVFDEYYKRTDENIALASKLKREKKLKFANSDVFEEERGAITNTFNFANLDTIEVANLSDARSVHRAISGNYDDVMIEKINNPKDAEDFTLQARARFFETIKDDFYLSIKNKGVETVGYDNTGNIVLTANYAYPMKSNGDIYAKTAGKMCDVSADSEKAFRTIKNKLSTYPDAIIPSDDQVSNAVLHLVSKAKDFAAKDFKEDMNIALPENVSEIIDALNNGTDEDANHALFTLQGVHSFVVKTESRDFLSKFDTSSDDFLVKDKSRIRFVPFSTDEAERFSDEFLDENSGGYNLTTVNAKLPMLTFPVEGNVINVKEITAPIVNIYTSKENENVLTMKAAAGIDSWFTSPTSGRLGLILSEIASLDVENSNAEKDLNKLMNYGFKNNNRGLLGIQKDSTIIKDRLGSHLNTIYNELKDNGLAAGQTMIRELSNSENPTLKTLGKYVEMTGIHANRNDALRQVRFAVNNHENTEILVKLINGEKVDMPSKFDAKRIYEIKSAKLVLDNDLSTILAVKSIDQAENPVVEGSPLHKRMVKNNVSSPLENTAKMIGYAVSATTRSKLIFGVLDKEKSTPDNDVRKYLLDNSLHAYPTGVTINPFLISNKANAEKKYVAEINLEKIAASTGTIEIFDIKDELLELKKEYIKNRPTYERQGTGDRAVSRAVSSNQNLQDNSDMTMDINSLIGIATGEAPAPVQEQVHEVGSLEALIASASEDTTGNIVEEHEKRELTEQEINAVLESVDMEFYDEDGTMSFEDDMEEEQNIGNKAKNLEKSKLNIKADAFR